MRQTFRGGTHVTAPGGGGALLLLAARFSPYIICSICSIICASRGIYVAGLGRNVRASPAPPNPQGCLGDAAPPVRGAGGTSGWNRGHGGVVGLLPLPGEVFFVIKRVMPVINA